MADYLSFSSRSELRRTVTQACFRIALATAFVLTACSASAGETRGDRKTSAARDTPVALREVPDAPSTTVLPLSSIEAPLPVSIVVDSAHIRHRAEDSSCAGFYASTPSARMNVERTETVRVSATAKNATDMTLAVRLPDGRWLCNDDGPYGRNPELIATFDPGVVSIYAGSYAARHALDYELLAQSSERPTWPTCAPERSITLAPGVEATMKGALHQPLHRCSWLLEAPSCAWLLPESPAACLEVTEPLTVHARTERSTFDTVMALQAFNAEGEPTSARWLNDDASPESSDSGLRVVLPPGRYGVFVGTYRFLTDGVFHLRVSSDRVP